MRNVALYALAVLTAMAPAFALAQSESASESAPHQIVWTFDPVRGTMLASSPAAVATHGQFAPAITNPGGSTTYTGTIDVFLTARLISKLTLGSVLRCTGSVGLEYLEHEQISQTEGVTVFENLVSSQGADALLQGATATCKLTIPYSWTVPASTTTNTITIQGITGSVGIAEGQLGTDGAVVRTYRSTGVALDGPTAIPADGTTTTLTAIAVL
jgi:hypothetical protein